MSHDLRFGVLLFPETPWSSTVERCRRVEALGFDSVWTGDHFYNPFRPEQPFLDGWTTITAFAVETSRVRIGTLVSNIILRAPSLLARQAVGADHISGGRLELGIGAGVFPTDHAMAGVEPWTPAERVGRLQEVVEIVDRLLRGVLTPYSGRYYWYTDAVMSPLPLQQPRPPLTVAANGTLALGVAARYADAWNTYGGFDVTEEQHFELAAERARILDEHCARVGRDGSEIRRSILVYRPLEPWRSVDAFETVFDRFRALGFTEFIFYWPREEQANVFERVALDVIPNLR